MHGSNFEGMWHQYHKQPKTKHRQNDKRCGVVCYIIAHSQCFTLLNCPKINVIAFNRIYDIEKKLQLFGRVILKLARMSSSSLLNRTSHKFSPNFFYWESCTCEKNRNMQFTCQRKLTVEFSTLFTAKLKRCRFHALLL